MIIRNVSDKRNSGVVPAIFLAPQLKGYVSFKLLCPACGFGLECRFSLANENAEAAAAVLAARRVKVSRAKSPCITMGFGNMPCYLWFFLGGDA
jgi:hypothetical protein